MGLIDKFKRGGSDENYDEMYGDDIYDGYDVFSDGGDDADDGMGYGSGYSAPASGTAAPSTTGTVSTPSYGTAASGGISIGGTALEMKVVKPEHFESVPQIADHLLNKRTVVLNLESTNKETARRLIDFLSGVAYSIDGSLKKIASNAYVITPNNVDVGDAMLKSGTKKQPDAQAPASEPETPAATQFGEI